MTFFSDSNLGPSSPSVSLLRAYGLNSTQGDIFLDFLAFDRQIAELVLENLHLTYVGATPDFVASNSLTSRGFEAHRFPFDRTAQEILRDIIDIKGSRRIAAIHISQEISYKLASLDFLKTLSGLARDEGCPIVISVPNAGNADVGFRFAAGIWGDDERLGRISPIVFTERSLKAELLQAGLEVIERRDQLFDFGAQKLHGDHPFTSPGSSVHELLRSVRENDPSLDIDQFVWLCTASVSRDPKKQSKDIVRLAYTSHPFISIVLRTQGKRYGPLKEAILSVAAQSFTDYELVIIGHRVSSEDLGELKGFIGTLPEGFQSKIRMGSVENGSRSAPLNLGLSMAVGQYVTFLDDDDFVFSNWLEVFHDLSLSGYGRVLRSQAAVQVHALLEDQPQASRAMSSMSTPYNSEFSLVEHIISNQSPFMTLAFPKILHDQFGMKFDGSLTTTEDWDFLLRAASLVGVQNSTIVTSVYRKWENMETSSDLSTIEWDLNKFSILKTLNSRPMILPKGEAASIHRVIDKHVGIISGGKVASSELWRLIEMVESKSWRWTAPLRNLRNFLWRKSNFSLSSLEFADAKGVSDTIRLIEESVWWQVTRIFRR